MHISKFFEFTYMHLLIYVNLQKKQLYGKIKLFQEKTCLGIQVVTFDIKNISEVEYEKK
jgi:hypothetical protein